MKKRHGKEWSPRSDTPIDYYNWQEEQEDMAVESYDKIKRRNGDI